MAERSPVLANEKTAKACWGAISALMEDMGMPQLTWCGLAGWQRELFAELVRRVRMGATPEQVHRHWREVAAEMGGWVYGDWDPAGGTHPWLCPWSEMPEGGRLVFKLQNQMVLTMSLDYMIKIGRAHV